MHMGLVEAQQTRRILDRLVGYKISPILWKKVKRGLSAGRVQSVAVKIICDREKEINEFVPKEYWSIEADLKDNSAKVLAQLHSKNNTKIDICNETQANEIMAEIEQELFRVTNVKKSKRKRYRNVG